MTFREYLEFRKNQLEKIMQNYVK